MELSDFAIALYIKVENGEAVEHPAMPDNLMQVFGKIPDNYEPFMRFSDDQRTPLDVFEVVDDTAPLYKKVNGIWTDAYARRPMTAEERAEKEEFILEDLRIYKQQLIDDAKTQLKTHTHPAAIIKLQDYINKMENLQLTWETRKELHPPMPIRFDEQGNLIDITNSGKAPNVIG
jgi:hypothetical protein